jgi:hypothetical protein
MLNWNEVVRFRLVGLLLSIILIAGGCNRGANKPGGFPPGTGVKNNLRFVKCRSHSGLTGPVVIPINSTDDGIARDDQITFVCDGETVRWDSNADSKVTSFTITFKNGAWPFGKAPQNPPVPLSSNAGVTMDEKVVGPTNKYAEDYEYTLYVTRSNGNPVTVDPHVIPMGP